MRPAARGRANDSSGTYWMTSSIKISAPEEIAYKNEWISKEKLLESAERYGKSPYGQHLKAVAEGKVRY